VKGRVTGKEAIGHSPMGHSLMGRMGHGSRESL